MRNVGGPVVFAPFLVFLIFDIRRAPPGGKLCEFVPRRSVGALDDFITEILLQLSGRYGDGYPRVLARSARCVRCERYGKNRPAVVFRREAIVTCNTMLVNHSLRRRGRDEISLLRRNETLNRCLIVDRPGSLKVTRTPYLLSRDEISPKRDRPRFEGSQEAFEPEKPRGPILNGPCIRKGIIVRFLVETAFSSVFPSVVLSAFPSINRNRQTNLSRTQGEHPPRHNSYGQVSMITMIASMYLVARKLARNFSTGVPYPRPLADHPTQFRRGPLKRILISDCCYLNAQ
ncbi:hypothetical protein ALC53_09719 [Atta colombica]|uniref:Secreted protein n=1 Tax=Atta colombica TaxID=520822 RepID=A0A195B6A5_9HYME|nr:hypothetical protein ALC53_09719 [Atta colombica]